MLLRNLNETLPLSQGIKRIAIFGSSRVGPLYELPGLTQSFVAGSDADVAPQCCGQGSGNVKPGYIVTPKQVRSCWKLAKAVFLLTVRLFVQGIQLAVPSAKVEIYGAVSLNTYYSSNLHDHFLDQSCEACGTSYTFLRSEGYSADVCPEGWVQDMQARKTAHCSWSQGRVVLSFNCTGIFRHKITA